MNPRLRRRDGRKTRAIVLAVATLALVWSPGQANAGMGVSVDPDDVPLRLDLKTVSHTNDASWITYTAETYEQFPDQFADFKWALDTNGDAISEFIVFAEWDDERNALHGGVEVDDASETELAPGTVWRTAPNAISVAFPTNVLGGSTFYRYLAWAVTDLNLDGEEQPGEWDVAPNAGLYQHDLAW